MNSVEDVFARLGGVATRASLIAAKVSPHAIARAVRNEQIQSVRRGWYAAADAPANLVKAVRVGGALTSVSAGAHYGLWTLEDKLLHVAVAPNASRLRSPTDRRQPLDAHVQRVCIHWRRPSFAGSTSVAPVIATLMHAIECQSEERALVMIDSALNMRLVTLTELQRAAAALSA